MRCAVIVAVAAVQCGGTDFSLSRAADLDENETLPPLRGALVLRVEGAGDFAADGLYTCSSVDFR